MIYVTNIYKKKMSLDPFSVGCLEPVSAHQTKVHFKYGGSAMFAVAHEELHEIICEAKKNATKKTRTKKKSDTSET